MRLQLSLPLGKRTVEALLSVSPTIGEVVFSYISTDSREAERGDLFISLAKDREAAIAHVKEAQARGAYTIGPGGNIDTCDTVNALLLIASAFKKALTKLKYTVAITGSVGKSSAKNFLGKILSSTYTVHSSAGNYNNTIGLPLSILGAPSDTEVLILELGMNHKGEIAELSRCAKPDVSVITAIGTSHIGNLGSVANILAAKLEIVEGMSGGTLIYPHGLNIPKLPIEALSFSVGAKSTFTTTPLSNNQKMQTFLFDTGKESCEMSFQCGAKHLLISLSAALSAAYKIGVPIEKMAKAVSLIDDGDLRHRIKRGVGITVLDDSYNSSLESASCALDYLMTFESRSHSAILADILELGDSAESIHYTLGAYAGKVGLSKLYLVGDYASAMRDGAISAGMNNCDVIVFSKKDNLTDIAQIIIKNTCCPEIILVKGSHATGISKITEHLVGGNHE